jgi:hypothetical protein
VAALGLDQDEATSPYPFGQKARWPCCASHHASRDLSLEPQITIQYVPVEHNNVEPIEIDEFRTTCMTAGFR